MSTLIRQTKRSNTLQRILERNTKTKSLIFCETQASVDWLHSSLVVLDLPFPSTHGGYSQEELEEAMFRFKKGHIPILISTMGISGRGVNLQGAGCIIFWDMPELLDQYKWCLGRVGR